MLDHIQFAIVIVSDRAASGERDDETGPLLIDYIRAKHGICIDITIVSDESDLIKSTILSLAKNDDLDVIITSGGTGIGTRDVTVDVTLEIIEKEIPGFGEEMRRRSLEVTPYAILSRATAGIVNGTLLVNLPGSPKGAVECLSWILKPLVHAVKILKKEITDCQSFDGRGGSRTAPSKNSEKRDHRLSKYHEGRRNVR